MLGRWLKKRYTSEEERKHLQTIKELDLEVRKLHKELAQTKQELRDRVQRDVSQPGVRGFGVQGLEGSGRGRGRESERHTVSKGGGSMRRYAF